MGIEPIIMSAGEMESEWAGFSSNFSVAEFVICSYNRSGFRDFTATAMFIYQNRLVIFVCATANDDFSQMCKSLKRL